MVISHIPEVSLSVNKACSFLVFSGLSSSAPFRSRIDPAADLQEFYASDPFQKLRQILTRGMSHATKEDVTKLVIAQSF